MYMHTVQTLDACVCSNVSALTWLFLFRPHVEDHIDNLTRIKQLNQSMNTVTEQPLLLGSSFHSLKCEKGRAQQ